MTQYLFYRVVFRIFLLLSRLSLFANWKRDVRLMFNSRQSQLPGAPHNISLGFILQNSACYSSAK